MISDNELQKAYDELLAHYNELKEEYKERTQEMLDMLKHSMKQTDQLQELFRNLARDSMMVMIALARMNGGEVRIPDRIIVQASDKDQIDTYYDDKTMEMVWKLKRTDRN